MKRINRHSVVKMPLIGHENVYKCELMRLHHVFFSFFHFYSIEMDCTLVEMPKHWHKHEAKGTKKISSIKPFMRRPIKGSIRICSEFGANVNRHKRSTKTENNSNEYIYKQNYIEYCERKRFSIS